MRPCDTRIYRELHAQKSTKPANTTFELKMKEKSESQKRHARKNYPVITFNFCTLIENNLLYI